MRSAPLAILPVRLLDGLRIEADANAVLTPTQALALGQQLIARGVEQRLRQRPQVTRISAPARKGRKA